jgi:hypothetical protein
MRARLGDDIDDFCVKCKRVMNHSVVSLLNDEPAKVRCRTCHGDHDYRHEQAPPPKVDPRKAALFSQVLEKVTGVPAEAEPGTEAAAVVEVAEAEAEAAEAVEVIEASEARPGTLKAVATKPRVVATKPKAPKKAKAR